MKRLFAAAIAALVLFGTSNALTIESGHPRLLLKNQDADLPRVRARCGIVDGDNMTLYSTEANDFAALFNLEVLDWIREINGFNDANKYKWVPTGCNHHSAVSQNQWGDRGNSMRRVAFACAMYAHQPSSAEFIEFEAIAEDWVDALIEESRCNQTPPYDRPPDDLMPINSWGEYARAWSGLTECYDWFATTGALDSYRLGLLAQVIAEQTISTDNTAETQWGSDIRGALSYKGRWLTVSSIGPCIALKGEPGLTGDETTAIDLILSTATARCNKMLEYDALCRVGTYPGGNYYLSAFDGPFAWYLANATDLDAVTAGSVHYSNVADWVMYASRKDWLTSDQTSDAQWLFNTFANPTLGGVVYGYCWPFEVNDPQTLWVLDQLCAYDLAECDPVFRIIYDDKNAERSAPTPASKPLMKAFTDLDPTDGGASQFAYMRSGFDYTGTAGTSTILVHVSAGPNIQTHDKSMDGHVAIFRGADSITNSGGVYDDTETSHGTRFFETPMSRNVITVIDHNSPYISAPGATEYDSFREGAQTGGFGDAGNTASALDMFDPFVLQGWISRADAQTGVQYIKTDLTDCWPTPGWPEQWPLGGQLTYVSRDVFQEDKYVVVFDRIRGTTTDDTVRVMWRIPDKDGPQRTDAGTWAYGVPPYPRQFGGTPGQGSDMSRVQWRNDNISSPGCRAFFTCTDATSKMWRVGGCNSQGAWNQGWEHYYGSSTRACSSYWDHDPTNPIRDYADPSFEFWEPELLDGVGKNMMADSCVVSSGEWANWFGKGYMGFWRLEIRSTGKTNHMLPQVFEVDSGSQTTPTATVTSIAADAEQAGVVINDGTQVRVTVVSLDETLDATVNYSLSSLLPTEHVVSDLLAGWYEVRQNGRVVHESVLAREDLPIVFRSNGGGEFDVRRVEPLVDAKWRSLARRRG